MDQIRTSALPLLPPPLPPPLCVLLAVVVKVARVSNRGVPVNGGGGGGVSVASLIFICPPPPVALQLHSCKQPCTSIFLSYATQWRDCAGHLALGFGTQHTVPTLVVDGLSHLVSQASAASQGRPRGFTAQPRAVARSQQAAPSPALPTTRTSTKHNSGLILKAGRAPCCTSSMDKFHFKCTSSHWVLRRGAAIGCYATTPVLAPARLASDNTHKSRHSPHDSVASVNEHAGSGQSCDPHSPPVVRAQHLGWS